ncbi:MAG: transglutaminase domain-containing protein [Bacteroidaceae bacterium]|nr:transglutaminase domain-containing protein [Bacteroidaceae bacterium]
MKINYLAALFCAMALVTSCGEEDERVISQETTVDDGGYTITRTFAEPDESVDLSTMSSTNKRLRDLLDKAGSGIIQSLGAINITSEQYDEIAEFTVNLTKKDTTQMMKYKTIFNWITSNIKYEYNDNDPYAVFKNRKAICQGYSNLLTVMCYSQGIPTMVVNGFLIDPYYGEMGHAWAYTCPDSTWTVSDPTNKGTFTMKKYGNYGHLSPVTADVNIFSDDIAIYNYYDRLLNIKEVRTNSAAFIVPYSVNGFVVNSLNPVVELPEDIAEIYVGQNIITLGNADDNNVGLSRFGQNLQAVYVDEKNESLMDHKGIVYQRNGGNPLLYYIPGGMTFVELLPMEVVGKNTIYSHLSVEEIYFPEGTKRIESFAIENCPKLKRIYIPIDAEIAKDALYKMSNQVEIVRGAPSGITNITMD